MTDQAERYDRIAEGYARWWGPVLEPTAHRLLDRVEPFVAAGARRLVDIGAGTGVLAIEAVRRWPDVVVEAIDASGEMLAVAEARARDTLDATQRARLTFAVAPADRLPHPVDTIDLAVSSFVLQLVPSRHRALREIRRVLRPGGTLAYVTWLEGGDPFAPDSVVDRALDAFGYGPRESDGVSGDIASPLAAVAELRRAGFTGAEAEAAGLEHRFDPASYLGFVTEFDEEDLFSSLGRMRRGRIERMILRGLERLPPEDLVLRLPVVFASGRRRPSGRAGG